MDFAMLLIALVTGVACVVWWLRIRWIPAVPSSWEAQRKIDEAHRQAIEASLRYPPTDDAPEIEADRLRVEVARLREENMDLRAMLPTDDYRTVRKGST